MLQIVSFSDGVSALCFSKLLTTDTIFPCTFLERDEKDYVKQTIQYHLFTFSLTVSLREMISFFATPLCQGFLPFLSCIVQ